MSGRGRTGRGVSERDSRGGQTQTLGLTERQYFARRTSVNASGRVTELIRGIASSFNTTRGGASGSVSQIPDYVVTVCGEAEERYPLLPPRVTRVHWPLPDPARATGSREEVLAVFRRSRDEIGERLKAFLVEILA